MPLNRCFYAITAVLAATIQCHAQMPNFCPPGSYQVASGYGYACQCPNGAAVGMGGSCGMPQSRPAPQVVQPRTQAPKIGYEAQKAIDVGQRMGRFDKKLEDDRRETAPGVKISDIADKNAQAKPAGYDYSPKAVVQKIERAAEKIGSAVTAPLDMTSGGAATSPRPNDTPKLNNTSMAAAAGTAFNGASAVGNAVTTSGGVNQWKDGGASQVNTIPSSTPQPQFTKNNTQPSSPSIVKTAATGFRTIYQDIKSLPSNLLKMGASWWGGSSTPPTTPSTPVTQTSNGGSATRVPSSSNQGSPVTAEKPTSFNIVQDLDPDTQPKPGTQQSGGTPSQSTSFRVESTFR